MRATIIFSNTDELLDSKNSSSDMIRGSTTIKGEHSSYCRKVEQRGNKFKIKAPMKITEKRTNAIDYFECGKEDRRHTTTAKRFWSLNDSQTLKEYFGEPRGDNTDDAGTYQVELY